MSTPANPFTLADWRHTVAEHYAAVRALAGSDAPGGGGAVPRGARAPVSRASGQPDRAGASRRVGRPRTGIRTTAAWRVRGVDRHDGAARRRSRSRSRRTASCAARASATRGSRSPASAAALAVYWFEGYGGGLWLPFSDASSGTRDLRRRPLSLRHDQGRRPRHRRRRRSCSTSTSRTTRRARTTTAGRARCRRRRIGCRSR